MVVIQPWPDQQGKDKQGEDDRDDSNCLVHIYHSLLPRHGSSAAPHFSLHVFGQLA
jgi:hypothetical protein